MRAFLILAALPATMFLSSCAGGRIFRPSPLKIASSFETAGNPDEAIRVLKNASVEAGIKPADKREILMALAELYAGQKDNLSAIQTLREAAQLGAGDPFIGLRLGELLLQEGLTGDALAEFVALEAMGVRTPSLFFGMGQVYHRTGRFLKASSYLGQYLKIYPDDKKALMMLYESYEALGKYPEARNALSGCAALMTKEDFAVKMAMNWMRDGNPDEAVEELEKIRGEYPGADFYLGLAYYQKGRLDDALKIFSRSASSPEDEASFFSALVLFELGRKDDARTIFRKLSAKGKYARYCDIFLQ